MEQLYVFGTGHAAVTHYYNTCFAIRNEDEYFMVDAGGGNGILRILEDMEVPISHIHHIFVTHEHTDHLLGVVWMLRFIASGMASGSYKGNLKIYCHEELTHTIDTFFKLTCGKRLYAFLGDRIHLIPVHDGEVLRVMDYEVTFFDIHSTKATQFGFTLLLKNGKKLTCLGDEPYKSVCEPFVAGSDWLLHEAFCLYKDCDRYHPYEIHHSTVKDACELSEQLHIPNLVLWHSEDDTRGHRKELYTEEGQTYYHGNLYVPDDGEILPL